MDVTRRYFLKSSGALSAYLGVAPLQILAAKDPAPAVKRGRTLVVLFLRGGADGLNLIVPYGDPHYARLRPQLAIGSPGSGGNGALALDGFFGLHPRLAPLSGLFESGLAVAAHAVGYAQNTRSHFEEQDVWETGVIGNTVNSDGWVNRHLVTSTGHGPIRAVAIGDNLPRIMHGRAPAFAIRGVEDLTLPGLVASSGPDVAAALEHAYCTPSPAERGGARDVLSQTTQTTLQGIKELQALTSESYDSVVSYPETELGRRLRQVARLIKADIGLEVAEVDYGGWDTHQNQGGGAGGTYGNLVGNLASAIDAFSRDLEERMDDVLLVTLTDFGRTAAENGTAGTDHGWANSLLAVGGAAQRGQRIHQKKVVGPWPGLAPDQLHQGRDLLHTTDFRDVIAELVGVHLGNDSLARVLPNHNCKPVGLVAT
jgi:uncharacterized protein (DUF1501 family)